MWLIQACLSGEEGDPGDVSSASPQGTACPCFALSMPRPTLQRACTCAFMPDACVTRATCGGCTAHPYGRCSLPSVLWQLLSPMCCVAVAHSCVACGVWCAGGHERWRVISITTGGRHSMCLALPLRDGRRSSSADTSSVQSEESELPGSDEEEQEVALDSEASLFGR